VNKYVQAIVIGVLAGVCVGFLTTFVFPEGPSPYFYGLGTTVFVAYILGNLAGNKKVAAAGADERAQALAMRPPAGQALLIVYREGFVARLAGMNLALDGRPFVQLTSPKSACLPVSPGQHVLSGGFGGLARPQSKGGELSFSAAEGAVTVVRINTNLGLVQGAIRFTAETDLAAAKLKLERMPMAAASAP
jgi:hypothetical protein